LPLLHHCEQLHNVTSCYACDASQIPSQNLLNPPIKPGDIINISNFRVVAERATFAVIRYRHFYCYGIFVRKILLYIPSFSFEVQTMFAYKTTIKVSYFHNKKDISQTSMAFISDYTFV